jgi:hypothetical protein
MSTGLLLASAIIAAFYGLIFLGPLDNPWIRRFSTGHWTMFACMAVFSIALVVLLYKYWVVTGEKMLTLQTTRMLTDLIAEGSDIEPQRRSKWLQANWLSVPRAIQDSWLGMRVGKALALQVRRASPTNIDGELKSLAAIDADCLCESYGLVKTLLWTLPLVGLLGALLSFSVAMVPLEAKPAVAADATHALRTTFKTALDPLVTSLALSILGILGQFYVHGLELTAIRDLDIRAQDALVEYLAVDSNNANITLFEPVKQMSDDLINSVHQLVEQQAVLWSRSIAESQRQWTNWTQTAAERLEANLGETISTALRDHVERMEKIQVEAGRQIDSRWQQWQVTLSDQARTIATQQKELIRLGELLRSLVDSTCNLQNLETVIHESVGRLENINRLEEASQCIGEAVAVLATSLERAGVIRGAPVRPRVARKVEVADPDMDAGERKAA